MLTDTRIKFHCIRALDHSIKMCRVSKRVECMHLGRDNGLVIFESMKKVKNWDKGKLVHYMSMFLFT